MRGIIEFSTNFQVEDREPTVLSHDGWSHRGKQIRTTHYYATGNTYGVALGGWSWYRYGVILKDNGEPRKDGAEASVRVEADDVPGYAQRALLKEIEQRAQATRDEIAEWVQKAKDLVTHVEVSS